MPIYEYDCSKCGVFEATQRITEEPLNECPICQQKVRKLISNTSFQLKGTGWYITDYGRGKGANGDKQESPANDGKDSSDASGSSDSSGSTGTGAAEKQSSGESTAATASR